MPTTTDTPISPATATMLVRLEKYVLPIICGFLAWQRLRYLQQQYTAWHFVNSHPGMSLFAPRVFYADLTKNFLIFAIQAFTGLTLLSNRAPAVLPDKLKHVMVPLAASYYMILYGLVGYFPLSMQQSMLPDAWRFPVAMAALACSIIGYAIAVWAIVYLRRSFAVFVSVRDVVTNGPYRLVRHPIYCGYLLDAAGLLLAASSVGMLLLCCGYVVLLVCRARMEEEMLAKSDPAYRHYLARTGFLFPRLASLAG